MAFFDSRFSVLIGTVEVTGAAEVTEVAGVMGATGAAIVSF
jgi:hypothetical protein